MIIGVPKELKIKENRVSLTPIGAYALVNSGHRILLEKNAGLGAGFADRDYRAVGVEVLDFPDDVWEKSDMILKIKEPIESEYKYLRPNLILFTYLHLANNLELTEKLIESKTIALAYETVQLPNRSLPLLTPMSEIAGRMAVQQGSIYLEKINGGKGILVDGVPGVAPAHIVVVGGGIVGTGAIRRSVGLGARVTVLDISIERLTYLNEIFMGKLETLYSNDYNLTESMKTADLVVGAVLIPGSKAPKLIKEYMVKGMEAGSVIVDVAIDQGGCVETIKTPTTHDNPTFVKHGVIHYAVTNIPGAVSRTSTFALTNVTLPYVMKIASLGWKEALRADSSLAKGANIVEGHVVYPAIASLYNMDYIALEDILNN